MPLIIKDHNSSSESYEFNISNLTNHEWYGLAWEIISSRIGIIRDVEIVKYLVKIEDNVAAVQLEYQGNKYHTSLVHINEFGLVEDGLENSVSKYFQSLMYEHYGDQYIQKLNQILGVKSI